MIFSPTHGSVNYQDKWSAQSKNLAYVQDDGTFVMAVDDQTQLNVGDNRDSCVSLVEFFLARD